MVDDPTIISVFVIKHKVHIHVSFISNVLAYNTAELRGVGCLVACHWIRIDLFEMP